jgi:cobalt transporter subunit CbtA
MTGRILSGALIAGLVAGLLAAMLNLWTLTPLILEAESFEGGHVHLHDDGTEHVHAAPEAPPGLSRAMSTLAMTLVTYAGFALVLGAGMALAARAGHRADARTGLLWGLAGFAAVQLAPAAGLPPELPGLASADLGARQAWWALCAAATAGGLATLAFGRRAAVVALGAALILLPHLLGAPQPPSHDGTVPPGLAAAFATRSLGVAALSWATLGALAGSLAERPALRPARA